MAALLPRSRGSSGRAGRSIAAGWPAALRRMMPAATGMLAVIKASLRTLSRPMSGSASVSPSSGSPKQTDGSGGDRDARRDQSGRRPQRGRGRRRSPRPPISPARSGPDYIGFHRRLWRQHTAPAPSPTVQPSAGATEFPHSPDRTSLCPRQRASPCLSTRLIPSAPKPNGGRCLAVGG